MLFVVILSTSGNFVVLVNLFDLSKDEKHLNITQSIQWQSINGMMAKQTVIQSFIHICNCFIRMLENWNANELQIKSRMDFPHRHWKFQI